jgi:phosphate transport system permease protein
MEHDMRVGAGVTAENADAPLDLRPRQRIGETIIQAILLACGVLSIFTTLGIVYVLLQEAWLFFALPEVSIGEFFTNTTWAPQVGEFGILPLLNATFGTTIFAMLVAGPLGLGAAIYLSEYASPRARAILKPILEVLAGVPTVVYGYFALTFVTPALLQPFFGSVQTSLRPIFNDLDLTVQVYNMLSAGLTMGIMILPLVASMSEDALAAVPRSLREASYGLGATRFETATRVVVPAALSGVIAAFIVAISRAVGETMIVALAAGAGPNFTFNPLQAAETMTGHIARISGGDISYGSIQYESIFAIGLTLFIITLLLNIISGWIVRRFREVYE